MEYILFNKHHPLCRLEIADNGYIEKITETFDTTYSPIGVDVTKVSSLSEWWNGRSIPASRSGIATFLSEYAIDSTKALQLKSYGLSLTDQYWIKPAGMDISWEKVNFFNNAFSHDFGDAFFNPSQDKKNISFMVPDNTSDGWLMKKWIIADGKRYLVKTSSAPYFQEAFNEVISSMLTNRLNINGVPYNLMFDKSQGICSVCENFINQDTELVPAYALSKVMPRSSGMSNFEYYLSLGEKLNIPKMREYLENLIVLDYLIANKDRHFGNFGFIRDINTLKFLGPAPIYDNGTSLWNTADVKHIGESVIAQPFNSSHELQLNLVRDWSRFDFSQLHDIKNIIYNIFSSSDIPARYAPSDERISAICSAIDERIKGIELHRDRATGFLSNVSHKEIAHRLKQFTINTEAVFVYYKELLIPINKPKYNPELDKKIVKFLLSDGFSVKHIEKIMQHSPNIKSEKMVKLLFRSMDADNKDRGR